MTAVRSLSYVLGFTFALALTAPAAQAREEGDRCEEMASELDLSDAQRSQLDELRYRSQSARIAIQARAQTAELDLHHAMMAATVDEKAISKALDALKTAEGELKRNHVDQMLAMRKLLTPEQWAKMSAMWRDHGDMEHGHDEKGGGDHKRPAEGHDD